MSQPHANQLCDIAVVGLGVMGANLARNFASKGFRVAGYDRDPAVGRRLAASHPEMNLFAADSYAQLVAQLERPRRIVVLVNAGAPVDSVLSNLAPLLDPNDVVVDAGNSHPADTDRRLKETASGSWHFVGMGVSGGAEGALLGPAMMPGGSHDAYERLRPVLERVCAITDTGPCVTWCGEASAGHFVKMVHNGIEYGDMQLIAEVVTLLRNGLGLSAKQAADTFARWNSQDLGSFLIEITADILRTMDPANPSVPLVDQILDAAGQKGTGKWTVVSALDAGVPVPTIAAALDARGLSALKQVREHAESRFEPVRGRLNVSEEDLGDALYAAKIASYTQGFQLLRAASNERKYSTNLSEVARTWTGGCIIRAKFLDRVREAFASSPETELLALAPAFLDDVRRRVPALRRVAAAAFEGGHAIPGLAASLAWFDTLTTARGSASVIQAQRDYFGSHTYARHDAPTTFVHTDWKSAPKA